jgi:ACS family glucarate transporter-like MFS transporter
VTKGAEQLAPPVSSTGEILPVSDLRRWSIVGLLFTASLINYFDRATMSLALPLLAVDFKLGPEEKGLLLSAFFWSYALMQVPIGWCADRFNLRWLYAGAFALWSVAQGLAGLSATFGVLLAFRILLGIGESVYLPGGSKIVSLLFPPNRRGLPSGIFDFGTRTGLVLEGLIVPWCLGHYGWRRTFLVVGFSALLWLVPWLLVSPRRLRASRGSRPRNNIPNDASPECWSSQESARAGEWRSGVVRPQRARPTVQSDSMLARTRALVTNRNLLGICLGFFCFDYYWYLLVTWLPDYLVTVRHLTILKAGFLASLPFFVFGVSEPIGGWLADRLIQRGWNETRTRKAVVTAAFATGLLLIPAARVESAGAAVALIAGGSMVGLATGNLLVILQLCAPPNQIGLWTGIENFAGNIGGILAPLITGLLISRTGSYSPGFALAAIILVAGLLSYWFIVGELAPPKARDFSAELEKPSLPALQS